jgi:hypothetical protein
MHAWRQQAAGRPHVHTCARCVVCCVCAVACACRPVCCAGPSAAEGTRVGWGGRGGGCTAARGRTRGWSSSSSAHSTRTRAAATAAAAAAMPIPAHAARTPQPWQQQQHHRRSAITRATATTTTTNSSSSSSIAGCHRGRSSSAPARRHPPAQLTPAPGAAHGCDHGDDAGPLLDARLLLCCRCAPACLPAVNGDAVAGAVAPPAHQAAHAHAASTPPPPPLSKHTPTTAHAHRRCTTSPRALLWPSQPGTCDGGCHRPAQHSGGPDLCRTPVRSHGLQMEGACGSCACVGLRDHGTPAACCCRAHTRTRARACATTQAVALATASGVSEPLGALLALTAVRPFVTTLAALDYVLAATGGAVGRWRQSKQASGCCCALLPCACACVGTLCMRMCRRVVHAHVGVTRPSPRAAGAQKVWCWCRMRRRRDAGRVCA